MSSRPELHIIPAPPAPGLHLVRNHVEQPAPTPGPRRLPAPQPSLFHPAPPPPADPPPPPVDRDDAGRDFATVTRAVADWSHALGVPLTARISDQLRTVDVHLPDRDTFVRWTGELTRVHPGDYHGPAAHTDDLLGTVVTLTGPYPPAPAWIITCQHIDTGGTPT